MNNFIKEYQKLKTTKPEKPSVSEVIRVARIREQEFIKDRNKKEINKVRAKIKKEHEIISEQIQNDLKKSWLTISTLCSKYNTQRRSMCSKLLKIKKKYKNKFRTKRISYKVYYTIEG